MISVQIQRIDEAEPHTEGGRHWVTLRSGPNRVVIHTESFRQAVAIATALNPIQAVRTSA